MSIVEKALERLRDAQGGASGAGPRIGRANGTPRPAAMAPAPSSAPAAASRRVVALDFAALRAEGLLPPTDQERQIARQYRRIKLPLLARAVGGEAASVANGRLILVASALPGEGKTFSTVNLALSMALERDTEVLLIDADIAKPNISQAFGLDGEPGLVDALADPDADIDALVVATSVPRLSVMPAGRVAGDTATELLGSARMKEVVARLLAAVPNRIVLFDSSPLLLTTESQVLAGVVGQVVLVVKAAVTERQAVFDAIHQLGEGKSVGVVVNQMRVAEGAGYYSGEGYGSYGSYGLYASAGTAGASNQATGRGDGGDRA